MEENEQKYLEKQLEYIKSMGYTVDNKEYMLLFPVNWFSFTDYQLKSEILNEAINKKCLVVDTKKYQEAMMEKVIKES